MNELELLLSICLGIGLSAACGFRVFVPMLGVSAAALTGHLNLADGFQWLGTWHALAVFATATVLEVTAYYIPWLDNLLDTIATPAAVVAGTIVTASVVTDMSPLLQWSLALIAGGGTAGTVQTATVAARSTSTLTTAGMGNFVIATIELIGSTGTMVLAFVVPIFCAGLVLLTCGFVLYRYRNRFARAKPRAIAKVV